MRSIVLTATVAMVIAASAGVVAQQPAAASSDPPDLSGIWGPRFVQSLTEDPPFLPEARKAFKEADPDDDPLNRCEPPGLPRLMNLAFPFEIVQTPEIVYFLFEYDQHTRRVFINGTHPEELDPMWLGHSIGRWEGRTLVVDTIGFNDRTWLDMRGHPHGEKLHIIERFTLSDDGKSLKHEVTIDDPETYSKPWETVTKSHQLRNDMKIQEFICEVA